jgi:hypothetical protein
MTTTYPKVILGTVIYTGKESHLRNAKATAMFHADRPDSIRVKFWDFG